jgi:Ser/Thr protein kinase RdoA (MazF antagonist)
MDATPYDRLSPDLVLDAIDTIGFRTDGTLTPLNSYENRVYQVGIEESAPVITKFYRPERWTDKAILEEHAFTAELAEHEFPCVAPMAIDGTTLFEHLGYRFSVFPRQAGHPPNIEDPDVLMVLGRTVGRMHAIGAIRPFEHRAALTTQRFGIDSREYLLANDFIPADITLAYSTISAHLLERIEPLLSDAQSSIRIHGDSHLGNLLWRYDAPNFVDFDDTMMGPAVQDLWMLLSGDRADRTAQLSELFTAYEDFFEFDTRDVILIEPLRALRMMYHASWIARRWHDPAFPSAFPWFNTTKYWSEHVLNLREQLATLDEVPLVI